MSHESDLKEARSLVNKECWEIEQDKEKAQSVSPESEPARKTTEDNLIKNSTDRKYSQCPHCDESLHEDLESHEAWCSNCLFMAPLWEIKCNKRR